MYVFLGNELTAEVAFPVVSTFVMLQGPLRMLPGQITNLIECFVGLKRIQDYLLAEEVDTKYIKKNDWMHPDAAVKIENGNFYWVDPEQQKKGEEENKNKVNYPIKNNTKKQTNTSKGGQTIEMKPMKSSQEDDGKIKAYKKSSTKADPREGYILKDINLEIKKGSFVAVIGE